MWWSSTITGSYPRRVCRATLGTRADIDVVGEAATGNAAVAVVIATMPDVVIMDLNLPDIDGVTATRRIIESGSAARILVLTMQADDESVVRAVRAQGPPATS